MEEKKTNPKRVVEMGGVKPSEGPRENARESMFPRMRKTGLTEEERHQLIAKAAYLRASGRGFAPGSELDDWFAAEAEIDRTFPKDSITRSA